jgi:hypothetical protein
MENIDKAEENFMSIMKVLRWPLEFIAVIVGGIFFIALMYAISGTLVDDLGYISLVMGYLILYLAGIIWVAASRIVRAIKKR